MSNFDNELEKILKDFAEVVRLLTLHPQATGEVNDPTYAIKQAVEQHVIGEDVVVPINESDTARGDEAYFTNKRNTEQRKALWGKSDV
jgi:hypothetical protein